MGIVDTLLTASRRGSPQEALRVTTALGAALDDPLRDPDGTVDALSVVAAAGAAHRRVALEIADEQNPRPAPPAGHTEAFAEPAGEESAIRDAPEALEDNVRTDPHYLLADPAGPPWRIPQTVAVAAGTAPGNERPADDGPGESCAGETGAGTVGGTAEDASPDDPEAGVAHPDPVPAQPPSPADDYPDEPLPGFSDGEELDHPPPQPPPASPAPSAKATPPPERLDEPDPDTGPRLAERVRQRAAFALGSLRGKGGRPKLAAVAAGVAAVLVIAVTAVFSLSGGRGKPPEPAGADAPPAPAGPAPAHPEAVLVPATVSASCAGDSDAVAPFAGEKSRAWVCGRANGLDGSVLNITFGKAVVVTGITIVPGFNYIAPDGRDEWGRHRLTTGVTWRLGGKSYPQAINPTRPGATIKLPAVLTQEMSMTITASGPPPAPAENTTGIGKAGGANSAADADATTAISSIVITGYPVGPGT